jgi:flagellar biosynthetic protein FlhB
MTVAPLLLGMMGLGIAGNLAQTGWSGSTKKLKPDFKKLDPFKGFKRMFSPASFWEAGKSALKTAILGLLAYRTMVGIMPKLTAGGELKTNAVIGIVAGEAMLFVRHVAMLGLVLAAADYAYQRRKTAKSMMMTKQEVKEEARQSDGDPHVKGQIRARQRKMSRLRMMAEVASADAVVVNPTHVAVAIKYDPTRGAPRVVAKGADVVATKIREEAEKHRVPMVEDIPLARTLFRVCELGDEIPAELYEAVARLLAFIFSLRANGILRPVGGGAHRPPVPLLPADQVGAGASR